MLNVRNISLQCVLHDNIGGLTNCGCTACMPPSVHVSEYPRQLLQFYFTDVPGR